MTTTTTTGEKTSLNRQMFVDRLRAWAARADNEVAESQGTAKRSWQGQASILRATASVVAAGDSIHTAPDALRLQIIADRQKSLSAWEQANDPDIVALHAGEVAAYDLILDLLKEATATWTT